MEITKELDENIQTLKGIPWVVDVTVDETPDYIEEQIKQDCIKFTIRGSVTFIEFFVPKVICLHEKLVVDPQLFKHIAKLLVPNASQFQKLLQVDRFYIDIDTQQLIRLDGSVYIDNLTEEQLSLISTLEEVTGVLDVSVKKVVDPNLLARVDCENAITVTCYTNDNNSFGFLLPERAYSDTSTHDLLKNELQQLFNTVK